MLLAAVLAATAACGPSVEEGVELPAPPELDHGPVNVPAAVLTVAPAPAPSHAAPRSCPAPQLPAPTPTPESGACWCPDAPEGVEAVCGEGERAALCGDTMPPPCRRAPMANAEHVACCAD